MADITVYHYTNDQMAIDVDGFIRATKVKKWSEGVFTWNMCNQKGVSFTQFYGNTSFGNYKFSVSLRHLADNSEYLLYSPNTRTVGDRDYWDCVFIPYNAHFHNDFTDNMNSCESFPDFVNEYEEMENDIESLWMTIYYLNDVPVTWGNWEGSTSYDIF